MENRGGVCFTATAAKLAFPNAKARLSSVANSPMTRPPPFSNTSPTAVAFAKPLDSFTSTKTPWPDSVASLDLTPNSSTMNSWLFPPRTREVQLDEMWSFVDKKEKHCDKTNESDDEHGDNWDHVAIDAENRLVLSVVPGERTLATTQQVVNEVKERLGDRIPNLITTDEYSAYQTAIEQAYGEVVVPERTGKPGRPRKPYRRLPAKLRYAVVKKTRVKGRVVKVECRVVFGTLLAVIAAIMISKVSWWVNTSIVERFNATARHRNARKTRKSYCFSKNPRMHEAVTYFTTYSYNYCWEVRTLQVRDKQSGGWQSRTPAMAAGLSDHVWTMKEWLSYPSVQRR
jgi:IS1 family transposase